MDDFLARKDCLLYPGLLVMNVAELGVSCLLRLVDLVIANLILIVTHNTFKPLAVDPLPLILAAYTPAGDGKSEVGIIINPCFLVWALLGVLGTLTRKPLTHPLVTVGVCSECAVYHCVF